MINFKEQLKASLNYQNISSSLFFQMKDGTIKRANIENQIALPNMTSNYVSAINSQIINNETLNQIVNISVADARKNVLYKYDLQYYPDKLQQVNALSDGDVCANFIYGQDDLSQIYAYIVIIHCADKDIMLYRKFHPINIYKKGMIMWWQVNRFDFVDEDLLKLDNSFDFLKVDNIWYIINLNVLEQNMGYEGILQKETKPIIEKIKSIDIIEDYQKFDVFCENITFAKKILRASKSPVLDLQAALIIEFTKNYASLRNKFSYSENGKIIISSREKMNLFMKLLNDDLLKSELTQRHYESLAKDPSE